LGADATGAVVDGEAVLYAAEGVPEDGIVEEAGEGLNCENLVVEDDCELAEWLFARTHGQSRRLRHARVRLQGRVGRVSPRWEIAAAWAGNDGVEIGTYDLRSLQDFQHRGARLRMADRVNGIIVEQRLPGGCGSHRGDPQVGVGQVAAVVFRAHWLDVDRAKEPESKRTAVALPTGL